MSLDALSTTFSALADPTRRAILLRLAAGEASVTELAEPFDISLPAISKHLKVLEVAGLVSRGRQAQFRPCRLEVGRLQEADAWLQRYSGFWKQSLDRLAAVLESDACPRPDRNPVSGSNAKSLPRQRTSLPRGRRPKSSAGGSGPTRRRS